MKLQFALCTVLLLAMPVASAQIAGEQRLGNDAGGMTGRLNFIEDFGSGIAPLGDLDGDGVPDLAVGAPGFASGASFASVGAVWILFLQADGTLKAGHRISDGLAGFDAVLSPRARFGASVAVLGDLDGDGAIEIAVGAPLLSLEEGAVWILSLAADGTVLHQQKIANGEGGLGMPLVPGDLFGSSVAGLGDLDGNGVAELFVGASGDDDGDPGTTASGAGYILFLRPDKTVRFWQKISNAQGGLGNVLSSSDYFGTSATGLGDLDGDGVPDVAVGTFFGDAVWILFLRSDGTVRDAARIAEGEGGFTGEIRFGGFGLSVANVGDRDRNGSPELVVGEHFGAQFWMLFLRSDGRVIGERLIAEGEGGFVGPLVLETQFGDALANLGDLDGDGLDEIAVGAPHDDADDPFFGDPHNDFGAVWVLWTECTAPASASVRNGSGLNPSGFAQTSPALLGDAWRVSVDLGAAGFASVVGVTTGGAFLATTRHGELLVDLSVGPVTFELGAGAHAFALPPDCGLIGLEFATQAAVLEPGSVRLQNAIDVRPGTF